MRNQQSVKQSLNEDNHHVHLFISQIVQPMSFKTNVSNKLLAQFFVLCQVNLRSCDFEDVWLGWLQTVSH